MGTFVILGGAVAAENDECPHFADRVDGPPGGGVAACERDAPGDGGLMNVRSALLSLILPLVILTPARAQEEGARTEVRSYQVRHLAVNEANAVVRSLVDVRKSAIDPDLNLLILRDSPERLALAADILRIVDVPVPQWTASIVAETAGGAETVRDLQLVGPASWASGGEPGLPADHLKITLNPLLTHDGLVADVEVIVAAGGDMGGQLLRRRESQRVRLEDGESMDLVRASHPAVQAALRDLAGATEPVRALRLSVSSGRPRGEDASRARRR